MRLFGAIKARLLWWALVLVGLWALVAWPSNIPARAGEGSAVAVDYPPARLSQVALGDRWTAWVEEVGGEERVVAAGPCGESPRVVAGWGSRKESPAVHGDVVVWADNVSGSWDIWYCNLATGETGVLAGGDGDEKNPAVWEEAVVFQGLADQKWSVYAVNLKDKAVRRLSSAPGDKINPHIWGQWVVWQDGRYDWYEICLYDLSTGEERILSAGQGDKTRPRIWGSTVVWSDERRDGDPDIYCYDLDTGVERPLAVADGEQVNPAVCGRYVLWQDRRGGNWDVYMADLLSGEQQVIGSGDGDQVTPAAWEDRVAWVDRVDGGRIMVLWLGDRASGETSSTAAPGEGLRVFWQGRKVEFATPPYLEEGRAYVPLRDLAGAMGAAVGWQPETRTALFEFRGTMVEMVPGQNRVRVNGKEELWEAPPVLSGGRTYVPVRLLCRSVGALVDWRGEDRTIELRF